MKFLTFGTSLHKMKHPIQGVSYCFGFFYNAPVTKLQNNLTCTDGFYMAKGWEF